MLLVRLLLAAVVGLSVAVAVLVVGRRRDKAEIARVAAELRESTKLGETVEQHDARLDELAEALTELESPRWPRRPHLRGVVVPITAASGAVAAAAREHRGRTLGIVLALGLSASVWLWSRNGDGHSHGEVAGSTTTTTTTPPAARPSDRPEVPGGQPATPSPSTEAEAAPAESPASAATPSAGVEPQGQGGGGPSAGPPPEDGGPPPPPPEPPEEPAPDPEPPPSPGPPPDNGPDPEPPPATDDVLLSADVSVLGVELDLCLDLGEGAMIDLEGAEHGALG